MPHWYQSGPPATAQADPAPADGAGTLAPADATDALAPADVTDALALPEAAGPPAPADATDALALPEAADPLAPADASDSPRDMDAADTPVSTDDTDSPVAATGRPAGAIYPRRTLALLLLGALTVILGGFGIWATVHASNLRAQSAQQNTALVDSAATSAVRDQVDSAVQTIFSYSYANTGATRQAAQQVLTGPAIQQYNSLFALVQREAPAEKLVVTTTVTNSGVELLTGGQARVLIFVNQQDTRAGTSQTTYGGAMLAVTAVDQAGRWKVENIDTFTGS
jgi:Mce-associated membrane protein